MCSSNTESLPLSLGVFGGVLDGLKDLFRLLLLLIFVFVVVIGELMIFEDEVDIGGVVAGNDAAFDGKLTKSAAGCFMYSGLNG